MAQKKAVNAEQGEKQTQSSTTTLTADIKNNNGNDTMITMIMIVAGYYYKFCKDCIYAIIYTSNYNLQKKCIEWMILKSGLGE